MERSETTPAEAMARLKMGNDRFLQRQIHPPATAGEIAQLGNEGQHPWAVVVSCSDSRVPPELVFDCGLGELFVIRTAGHVLTDVALGSVVYAVRNLGIRLVLVLGHSGCGAVAAALSGIKEFGTLGSLLDHVAQNVNMAMTSPHDEATNEVDRAERSQIYHSACVLRADPALAEVNGLEIAEAKYDTHTGRVSFLAVETNFAERRCTYA